MTDLATAPAPVIDEALEQLQERIDAAGVRRQRFREWRLCAQARDRLDTLGPDWQRAARVAARAYEEYQHADGHTDGLREARNVLRDVERSRRR